ncbi:MAG: S46 family peptidase, partial [Terriglobales bacterium]
VGYNAGLLDEGFMARKRAEESKLRDAVAANAKLKAEFGDPWSDLEKAVTIQKQIGTRATFVESTFNSNILTSARTLVRAADEKQKPNTERLREFRESSLPMLERRLLSPLPVYKNLDILQLTDSLKDMVETLGPDDPFVRKVLGGKTPEQLATDLINGSELDKAEARKKLYDGGKAAIDASTDPAILLMKAVDADAREVRKQIEQQVTSVEQRAGTQIAKIMFAEKGFTEPPDATGTLRLSYGVVKGYTEDGRKIPYFTTFTGAFQHAATHTNQPPYFLPETWMAFNPGEKKDGKVVNAGLKAGKLNVNAPLNFVSTPDIIGGNSGSPVVNKEGEIVGIIFDGNIQSLPMRFMYEDVVGRAVSVDSRGILEALRNIYGAGPLVDELVGPQAKEVTKPATLKEKK